MIYVSSNDGDVGLFMWNSLLHTSLRRHNDPEFRGPGIPSLDPVPDNRSLDGTIFFPVELKLFEVLMHFFSYVSSVGIGRDFSSF